MFGSIDFLTRYPTLQSFMYHIRIANLSHQKVFFFFFFFKKKKKKKKKKSIKYIYHCIVVRTYISLGYYFFYFFQSTFGLKAISLRMHSRRKTAVNPMLKPSRTRVYNFGSLWYYRHENKQTFNREAYTKDWSFKSITISKTQPLNSLQTLLH